MAHNNLSTQGKVGLAGRTRHDEHLDAQFHDDFEVVRSKQALRHPHIPELESVLVSVRPRYGSMALLAQKVDRTGHRPILGTRSHVRPDPMAA
jgi:hypothetical protein